MLLLPVTDTFFLFLHYKGQYRPSNFTASIHRTIKKKLLIDTVMNFVFMFTAINSFYDTEGIEYICCGPGVPYLTLLCRCPKELDGAVCTWRGGKRERGKTNEVKSVAVRA